MHYAKTILTVLAGALISAAVWAQQSGGAVDHSKMDHAAMGHGAPPAVAEGPWSYRGRNNPAPHTRNRWEMVPVPQYGHMFIGTQNLSRELRCAALDNPGVMVDRKTRQACGFPEVPPSMRGAPTANPVDHKAMGH